MTPFKFLKRKKEEKKPKKEEIVEAAKEAVKEKKEKKEVKEAKVEVAREKSKKPEKREAKATMAWRYIVAPHITEKATLLAEKENQYVFKVAPDANKIEVKKAIEDLYGVKVEKVRIIKVPRKRRRRGRIEGWRKGYKKAIVKIKEGQKIEILPR